MLDPQADTPWVIATRHPVNLLVVQRENPDGSLLLQIHHTPGGPSLPLLEITLTAEQRRNLWRYGRCAPKGILWDHRLKPNPLKENL